VEPAAVIDEACRLVRGLITDPSARLSVAIETGPDEAVLVGTADAYLRLALASLEFVADTRAERTERQLVGGVQVAGTTTFGEVFAPGEVGVSSGWLAGTAGEAKSVGEYILRLSPPADQDA
jgi:hypothetical protein